MLYLGIDQHARQLTISLRDESGDVLQARQVWPIAKKLQHIALDTQLTPGVLCGHVPRTVLDL
jgi:hypothetical protein